MSTFQNIILGGTVCVLPCGWYLLSPDEQSFVRLAEHYVERPAIVRRHLPAAVDGCVERWAGRDMPIAFDRRVQRIVRIYLRTHTEDLTEHEHDALMRQLSEAWPVVPATLKPAEREGLESMLHSLRTNYEFEACLSEVMTAKLEAPAV